VGVRLAFSKNIAPRDFTLCKKLNPQIKEASAMRKLFMPTLIGRFMIFGYSELDDSEFQIPIPKIFLPKIYNRQPARVVPEIGTGGTRPRNGSVDQHYNGKKPPPSALPPSLR
jgi:hypothetical protein